MLNPYELMYNAKMTINRWKEVEVDGYARNVLETVASSVSCRYSSSGQVATGIPKPEIKNSHTLFCGLNVDIQEGDQAVISLPPGKVVKLRVGECHPYTYQWQCEVFREDNA